MDYRKKPLKELLNFCIVNLDKPSGPTSFTVSEFVKNSFSKYGVKKTSHFGTLDPKVTGVLPVAVGRACKLTGYFLGHDKTYVGILRTHEKQEIKKLQEIINKNFVGKIQQLPPVKSRVKRAVREREVFYFNLLESSEDKTEFLFETKVQGGTYIRKLCSDLEEFISCKAHMLELRRIDAGIFSEADKEFVNLYDFEKSLEDEEKLREILIPAEEAIKKVLPVVEIVHEAIKALYTGKPLFKKDCVVRPKFRVGEVFAVFCEERFIGIYKKTNEEIILGRPEFVFN